MGERQPWRDMTADELAAWNGLISGDLDPLADVLENEDGVLHPVLQRYLVKLIRGSVHDSDYRLRACKHPDLKKPSDGPRAKRLLELNELRTASIVAQNGGFERRQTLGAFKAAMDATGLKERQVKAHWAKHKNFLRFARTLGLGAKSKPR